MWISEILFGFGYKISDPNPIVQNFDTHADGFRTENCMQSAVQIQRADKERFKTRPKPSLAYRFQNGIVVVVSDVKVY